MSEIKNQKVLRKYNCPWCNYNFEQYVGIGYSNRQSGKFNVTKAKKVSDQVKCPKCQNFLKTW